jgi:hypothetical protein
MGGIGSGWGSKDCSPIMGEKSKLGIKGEGSWNPAAARSASMSKPGKSIGVVRWCGLVEKCGVLIFGQNLAIRHQMEIAPRRYNLTIWGNTNQVQRSRFIVWPTLTMAASPIFYVV